VDTCRVRKGQKVAKDTITVEKERAKVRCFLQFNQIALASFDLFSQYGRLVSLISFR